MCDNTDADELKIRLRGHPEKEQIDHLDFRVVSLGLDGGPAPDDRVCSNPWCDETGVSKQATVGCDVNAMVCDFADLPFCSNDCLDEFRSLTPVVDLADRDLGVDTRIFRSDVPETVDESTVVV